MRRGRQRRSRRRTRAAAPRARFLLSEGAARSRRAQGDGTGRWCRCWRAAAWSACWCSGRARGGAAPCPTDAEARLVSAGRGRAALAFENHALPEGADRVRAHGRAGRHGGHAGPRLPRAHDRDPRLRGDAARRRRAARTRWPSAGAAIVAGGGPPRAHDRRDPRLRARRRAPGAAPVPLARCCGGARRRHRAGAARARRSCATSSCPAAAAAALDVDKLRRAVANIAANARDAMGGPGRLRLQARLEALGGAGRAARAAGAGARRTRGRASPPEIRERVFEPFVTRGKKGGTGLGLAVARRFVEDHGGRLELVLEPGPRARARGALPARASAGAGQSEERRTLESRRWARSPPRWHSAWLALALAVWLPPPRPAAELAGERPARLLDRRHARSRARTSSPRSCASGCGTCRASR